LTAKIGRRRAFVRENRPFPRLAPPVLKETGMRVVIAEDSESVRFALRLVLEHLGHEVVAQAANGEEAVAAYLRQQPELVVMDVRMPVMDGLASAALLRQLDPQARVVIVTAGRTTESQARAAGASGFVEKPFDIATMSRVINHLAA